MSDGFGADFGADWRLPEGIKEATPFALITVMHLISAAGSTRSSTWIPTTNDSVVFARRYFLHIVDFLFDILLNRGSF